jgi:F-box/leucine-rich repeat protein 2/20
VRTPNATLATVPTESSLHTIDLSHSWGFNVVGLTVLVGACPDLGDLDLSNVVDLWDTTEVAGMRRLWWRGCESRQGTPRHRL